MASECAPVPHNSSSGSPVPARLVDSRMGAEYGGRIVFRLRYAVALVAAVCLISPGVSQSAVTYTWAGTWTITANTCCGKAAVPMTLDVSGNGSYSFCGGRISGAQI